MGSSVSNNDDEGINDINVTPLVDVMLVLLIIFMVTANYITNQAINLELPKAATGQDTGATNLGFSIDKDAKLFLDGKPVTYEELPQIIAARKKEKPDVQALISADVKTPHGDVVKLIDTVRRNGILNFAINVEVEAQ
ncbi:MAG: biopolymer transporter ExbD [Pseudobdellovibrionaceae bacterium]|uniref:ExbD/TolR family protein n=1 Tax=Oligoflexus sp. TaxID=1971216 RepID=UPI0027C256E6|nr:biopolymer transporter ExbD [Oligoflexus sp.]MDQ3235129.1 biopolymer transporter ExbD [Pseudobdellovibrionaceae bacterium]HYX39069.1 biopolymer transporter ExbD [Oligoflexus sp.]